MRSLLSPRWIAAHAFMVTVTVLFIGLGSWQLDRLHERQLDNAVGESRYQAEPIALPDLTRAAGDDIESLEYRRTTATGLFDTANEVLIRSQVFRGNAGFHVITPLILEDGPAVIVDRGWVPLGLDAVPVTDAAPEEGTVTVDGWIRLSQMRPALGPVDPADGRLIALSRVDLHRIQAQLPYEILPVYVSIIGTQSEALPVPPPAPVFDDEGPHLAYALQWFGFALVGVIGYFFLARRALGRGAGSPQEQTTARGAD